MRRWHSLAERRIMLRRWRQEIAIHEGFTQGYSMYGACPIPPQGDVELCHCYRGMGFVRKQAPLDCGKTQCAMCHWDKYVEPKARQNKKHAAILFELDNA